MHIVYVDRGFPRGAWAGGAGTYILLTGRELVRRGCRVSVIAPSAKPPDEVDSRDGITVYRPVLRGKLHWYASRLPLLRTYALALRHLEQGRAIQAVLRKIDAEHPIDLIEYSEGGDYWQSVSRRVPYVSHLHGSANTFRWGAGMPITRQHRLERRLELRFIARASHVFSPSQAMADRVAGELQGRMPAMSVIPYPLDPSLLATDVAESGGEECLALFASRSDPVKGGSVLVDATIRAHERAPNLRVQFYGFEPTDQESARAQAAGGAIEFRGFLPRDELLKRYAEIDMAVVPSLWDNSPNTVYEAMAAGKAVVASRAGGIPEIVGDGETGTLVPPGDSDALADALVDLATDAAKRSAMGRAGRDRIARLADINQTVSARMGVYEGLLSGRPAAVERVQYGNG